ncbi:MAG: hypothetical protein WD225_02830 [Ilumatobacteraceae bacterium]
MTAPVRRRGRPDPDELAELEEERRFLLASLRDLERERAVGDVDDHDYETLREGYTVRAAEVLRAIERGRDELPPKPPRQWWRVLAWTGVVIAVAVASGLLLARASGQRMPGQEITGGIPGDDVPGLLVEARDAMFAGDFAGAQRRYGQVLEERPDHPEALAYNGWLLALLAQGAGDDLAPIALETAKESLYRAIELAPDYADPHCFLAIIAANYEGDEATAAAEADECLANDPPADMRGLLDEFVLGVAPVDE